MFEISGKVVLVTGGASGIGLKTAEELLKEGARGVAIADISKKAGEKSVELLRKKYGHEKIIFVHTDVANKNSLDDAFKRTLAAFNNIDIVVNNAGILNEKEYELMIRVNLTGSIHCMSLAMDKYLPTYKSGSEAVIINTISDSGSFPPTYPFLPVDSATKSALISLTLSLGSKAIFKKNQVRVVGIAPGVTATDGIKEVEKRAFSDLCREEMEERFKKETIQSVDYVAKSMIDIIKNKPTGTVWMAVGEQELTEFIPALPTYEIEEQ